MIILTEIYCIFTHLLLELVLKYNWRPSNLSELTPCQILSELTHFNSEAPNSYCVIQYVSYDCEFDILKLPSLSGLTSIMFNMESTHLGLEAPIL